MKRVHMNRDRQWGDDRQNTWPLWLVDAFTGEGCLGNPAGVCLVESFPPDEMMQQLAFELHWSETAFVKKIGKTTFHIRWFAPEDEAPMCGHATLGAAHVLFENHLVEGNRLYFQSCAGGLVVDREIYSDGIWLTMDFPACPLIAVQDAEVLEAFRDILAPMTISQLLQDPIIFVALLESEEAVRKCSPHLDRLAQQSCRAVSITAPASTPGFDFVSRYFAPKVGIPEDPVCGSSHCRLIPFWAAKLDKPYLNALQVSRRGGVLKTAFDSLNDRVALAGQARTRLKGSVPAF